MQETNGNSDGGVWKSFPLLPVGCWEGSVTPGVGVYCSVGVRIDEQMILPFRPALTACYLQNSATYILLLPLLLSVAPASLQGRGGCDPKQALSSAVQCGEHEGHRCGWKAVPVCPIPGL